VVLWDQYHPEMKKSILVSEKDLTWRQAIKHLEMFLLNYIAHILWRKSIKVISLPLFSYV